MFLRAKLKNDSGSPVDFNKAHQEVHPLDANLISSQKANGRHILMLDLDMANHVVSSSTPGHSHVYVNTDLELDALKEIIDVLAKHGVVQQGIKNQLDQSGFLTLRPPGIKKGDAIDDADLEEAKKLQAIAAKPKKQIKDLSKSFKALKEHLKNGGQANSKDVYSAYEKSAKSWEKYGAAVTQEYWSVTMSAFLSYLDLKDVMITEKTDTGEMYLIYGGKRFCRLSEDPWTEVFQLVFYEKDFHLGDTDWPSWEKVKEAIKACF